MSLPEPSQNVQQGKRRKRSSHPLSAVKRIKFSEGTSRRDTKAQQWADIVRNKVIQVVDTFTYSPLHDIYGEQIRVLVVEPGEGDDPIVCRLVPSALPTNPDSKTKVYAYTALSYYWGSGIPRHPITLTNYATKKKKMRQLTTKENIAFKLQKRGEWTPSGTLHVRSNLFTALRTFRDKKRKVTLWIDALCIDQNDTNERTRQVRQMHEVYSSAEKVRIWLGNGSDGPQPKPTFKFLRKILNLRRLDELLAELRSSEANATKWMYVVGLIRNTWFSRRWVIQELALSKDAWVHYGDESLPWAEFSDAIALFTRNYDMIGPVLKEALQKTSDSLPEVYSIEDMRSLGANTLVDTASNLFRRSEDGHILQRLLSVEVLVSTLLAFEASDPKDTIYAVLSLAKDTHIISKLGSMPDCADTHSLERLNPDYGHKNLRDVYTDFIAYCVDTSKSLDILCRYWAPRNKRKTKERSWVEKAIQSTSDESLPTWIPSIELSSFGSPTQAIKGRYNGDSFVGNPNRQRNYNATADLPPYYRFGEIPIPEGQTTARAKRIGKYDGRLLVRGLRLGTVTKVSHRIPRGIIASETLELAGCNITGSEGTGDWTRANRRVPDEFWRTLVADRGPEGANPPSWYQRACMECLNHLTPGGDLETENLLQLKNAPSTVKAYLERVRRVIWNRKFMRIEPDGGKSSTCGLASAQTEQNDIVCVLFGCSVPVVLRSSVDGDGKEFYQMVGECYVHGMMDGEAVAGKRWKYPYKKAMEFELR